MTEIKNIQDLITDILDNDSEFVGVTTSRLTAAGDNYGSSMLKVDITLKNKEGQTEDVHAVAKMLPQNKFVQKVFNSEYTFRNEVGFYKKIAPLLRDFQKEQGLTELFNSFPGFYGARLSLDPGSDRLDEDAILLIKNIQREGFSNVDRTIGFDFDQSKLILQKMAELHGTFLAFKLCKPEVFDRELSCFFREFRIFDFSGEEVNPAANVSQAIIDMVKDDEFCAKHLSTMKEILDASTSSNLQAKNRKDEDVDQFFSFLHCDMWSNNIMVKIVDGKIVDVKFVDFQIYEYSSLTKDVVFFLFSSVQLPVLRMYCDELLNFYYENLIEWLKKFNCDTSKYSFNDFIETMKKNLLISEFFHIMLMLGPIYAEAEHVTEVEDMSEETLLKQRKEVSEQCKEKGCFIVKELITRGWLKIN